jgi:hypothetical protein
MNLLAPVRRMKEYLEERRCRRLSGNYALPGGDRRIYLYHIRKTGGTSLIHMFLASAGIDGAAAYDRLRNRPSRRLIVGGKVFTGWDPARIERGHFFFAFSHLPHHQIRLPPKTFTLTCLRDPVARVLSHYKMLLGYQQNSIDHPCMAREGPWLGNGFEDFLARIPTEDLLNQLYMFSATFSVDEAADRIRGLSHVLFLEDLASGTEELSAKVGLPLKVAHVRQGELDVELKPQSLLQLRERLDMEYGLLAKLSDLRRF